MLELFKSRFLQTKETQSVSNQPITSFDDSIKTILFFPYVKKNSDSNCVKHYNLLVCCFEILLFYLFIITKACMSHEIVFL